MTDEYIWIVRWPDFQHYRPERDRPPAWIKDYTKQDDDDDYRALTFAARGVLSSLRRVFAKSHGKLRGDTATLTRRLGQRVLQKHLDELNHAGFIEFVSREVLEQRLEQLYSPPRVRVDEELPSEVREENDDAGVRPRDDDGDDLRRLIEGLKPSATQRLGWQLHASVHPDLARRQIRYALEHGRNPAAYFDDLVSRGVDPAGQQPASEPFVLDPEVEKLRDDRLAHVPPRVCPECEIGGGKHVEGCSRAVTA